MSQTIELEKRFSPFSSGSHFTDWQASNCDRCKKFNDDPTRQEDNCELDTALLVASCDDGTVSQDIAVRLGYLVDGKETERYVWPCGEVEWTEEWKTEWLARQGNQ